MHEIILEFESLPYFVLCVECMHARAYLPLCMPTVCVCVCKVSPGVCACLSCASVISCSCSLSSLLHPLPPFHALAEVSPVLFNPASLIPITFHLLHSAYCPTALESLLQQTPQTPQLSDPCNTCTAALCDIPAALNPNVQE